MEEGVSRRGGPEWPPGIRCSTWAATQGCPYNRGVSVLTDEKTYCVVCAWRLNCQKKYAFESSGQYRCPDYSRDVTIKKEDKKDKDN